MFVFVCLRLLACPLHVLCKHNKQQARPGPGVPEGMSEGVERTEGAEGTLPRVVCEGENLQQVWRGVFSTFSTLIFTIDKS